MLRRFLFALSLSTALTAIAMPPAQADPVTLTAVGTFMATPVGSVLTNVAIGVGLNAASGLIHNIIGGDKTSEATGIHGTVSTGGDGPIRFVVGDRMTAGTLVYRGTWGSAGSTPNAYYVEERVISDLPLGISGLWVDGKLHTVDWGGTPVAQGYPIPDFRKAGVDYAWFKWAAGDQTTADSYLLAKFGADPNHPYTADMIGRGQAKGILTVRANREIWKNGFPSWSVETSGIALYNIAKDSTAGGTGAHRWADPATWEPSNLLPVIIYNLMRGIRYGSEWVYGGQTISATQLPPSSWIAAIVEAGTIVAKADASTEKQWTGGFEIAGDVQPADVIDEALKRSAGRIADIGGIYKMICGIPASTVMTISDADIITSRDQSMVPFPRPDAIYNAISSKDSPPRTNATWEALDGGERRSIEVTYEMVSSGTQVQRLDSAAIADARRFVTHRLPLPPIASELEPLDLIAVSSDFFGYTAKKFLIVQMDDEETYEQFVTIRETNPADFGYIAATDELPTTFPSLSFADVPAVQMSGYQVFAISVLDSAGIARRPDLKVRIPGGLDDVASIKVTVRLASSAASVYQGTVAYQRGVIAGSYFEVPLNGVFLPAMAYEVQFDEIPFSARATLASDWFAITTPNIGIGAPDLDLINLGQGVLAQLGQVRTLVQQFNELGTLLSTADVYQYTQRKALARSIEVRMGDLEASFNEIIEVALGPGGAIATALEALYAAMGGNTAAVNVRWEAQAAPSGFAARYAITAEVNDGHRRSAVFFIDVPTDNSQPTRVGSMADQFVWFASDGTPIGAVNGSGIFGSVNGVVQLNLLTGAFSITVP
jgi:hypothetical protein